MDQPVVYLGLALQCAFAAGAGVLCLAACRWSARVWAPLGLIVALGILSRAWSGVALFWISFWNLPILSTLHTGDGFWNLAPDARLYYGTAVTAAIGSVPPGAPSPRFIEALGIWMRLAGESPASPVLFNMLFHVATCVALIAAFQPLRDAVSRRAAAVTLSIFSFSPVLILLGTQSLKDVFFTFLVVFVCVAVAGLLSSIHGQPRRWSWMLPLGILFTAVFLIGGVRPYYGLFVWGSVCGALVLRLLTLPRQAAVPGTARALTAAVLLWGAFMWGAGEYYPHYASLLSRTTGIQLPFATAGATPVAVSDPGIGAAFASVRELRLGFVRSGGDTNLAREDQAADSGAGAALLGLVAIFVPITALAQLSLVDVPGGRLALITDLDTLFGACALATAIWVLVTSRRLGRSTLPYLAFGLALGLLSAVLLGYVVTNYGTLFRLRLMATVPFWLLPLAVRTAVPVAAEYLSRERNQRTAGVAPRDSLHLPGPV